MTTVWMLLAFLVLVAGLAYRLRIRQEVGRGREGLSEEQIRRIEETGSVDLEDSLDMDEIERAEDEFWEESWDEPEPW